MRSPARWNPGPAGLVRVSTDPGGLDLPDDLDLSDPAAGKGWAVNTWTRAEVRAALAGVSPALCTQLDAIAAGRVTDAAALHRAAASLASYLLRWQRRATPLAGLAGVGALRIGDQAKVRYGAGHRLCLRADSLWLAEAIVTLHQCPQLVERLKVIANNAVTIRGGRLVAPGQPPIGTADAEALSETSARATGPARAALLQATEPIVLGDLRRQMAARYPAASAAQIDAVLSGLVDQQFLITELHIPLAELDALAAVCRVLRAVDAQDIPQIADLVTSLFTICDALVGEGFETIPAGLAEQMLAVAGAKRTPLLIDTAVDCEVEIPAAVAREAADAVDVLYRLSPHMGGTPSWREYQNAFRSRYGTGALVPVLELLADSGLGLPSRYLGSMREHGPKHMSERDSKLLALIQDATLTGSEIVLTERTIEDLANAPVDATRLPVRSEVAFRIRAASTDDIDAGRFLLELTGTPRPGASMAGRHAHLLSAADRAAVAQTFGPPGPEMITAQLSFPPRYRSSQNVARTAVWAPALIPVAEYHVPGENVIALHDLAVTAEGADLHLIQLSTGRRVIPMVTSALEAVTHTLPLARFLSEVATACHPTFGAFAFSAANRLPHLPRLRYRRTILSPARWRLSADQLPGRDVGQLHWDADFAQWRQRWRVPDHVAMIDHDRRQPIDLTHRAHRHLLRTRLERNGRLEIAECATPADDAWIGRAHEILLPVTRTPQAAQAGGWAKTPPAVDTSHVKIPAASDVLAIRLHAHPERFDEIIADRLPALAEATASQASTWWFHRHRDLTDHRPGQHLAVYLRLDDPALFADAAAQAAAWTAAMHRERLISQVAITDWQPPTGRYGYGEALEAALRVFAADSTAAVAQLQAARAAHLHPQILAAVSYVDLAAELAGSPIEGRSWLLGQIPHASGHIDPGLRDQALAAAEPPGPLHGTPAGTALAAMWRQRASALADYASALSSQRDPIGVLEPLLHLHHLRAVGAWPKAELVTGRLARAIALRQQARSKDTR